MFCKYVVICTRDKKNMDLYMHTLISDTDIIDVYGNYTFNKANKVADKMRERNEYDNVVVSFLFR